MKYITIDKKTRQIKMQSDERIIVDSNRFIQKRKTLTEKQLADLDLGKKAFYRNKKVVFEDTDLSKKKARRRKIKQIKRRLKQKAATHEDVQEILLDILNE